MDEDDYNNLKNNNLKMLILGYKTIRRGKTYIKSHMREVITNQTMLVDHFNDFKTDLILLHLIILLLNNSMFRIK